MEFPHVTLADDFWDLVGAGGPIRKASELDPEEVRLTYVALTRAIHTLSVNSQLAAFMTWFSMQENATATTSANSVSDFLNDLDFEDETELDLIEGANPAMPAVAGLAMAPNNFLPAALAVHDTTESATTPTLVPTPAMPDKRKLAAGSSNQTMSLF